MAEFKVPELGENVAQGDVTRILVQVGDTITHDQPILELETDKATIEVPSSVAGVVRDIKVKTGDKVQVGSVILVTDDAGNGASAPKKGKGESPAEDAAPPDASGDSSEAASAEDRTERPERTEQPERTEESGRPEESERPERREKPDRPEKVVSMASVGRSQPATAGESEKGRAIEPRAARSGPAAPAAPSVRRLAREVGVEINEVQGSGPKGRISEADVKEHARRILTSVGTARPAGVPGAPSAVPLPDFSKWGEVERQPMSNIRRKTAEHLSHAWTTIPHVTQFDKADITPMEDLRSKFRKQVEQAGGNLTVTAVLVKVLGAAVKQFPQFNASVDVASGEIVYKKYVNVGVAVDTERGLLVPVIRNVDRKNIQEIAVDLQQLSEKARSKKLSLEEMSGGGISISNLGGIGGTYFTPIVNWPEVAILGVSRGVNEPVWRPAAGADAGAFEPRQMLPLSLSYDHRVIDGADAMRFLRWVVQAIEQPFLLSLLG